MSSFRSAPDRLRALIHKLGPGIISGASRNDPCSITAYAVVGAKAGYSLLWTLVLTVPLLAAIQDICARVGRTTGRGIAGNLKLYYPKWLARLLVVLLVVTNVINLAADAGMMGEAAQMLAGGSRLMHALGLLVLSVALLVWLSFNRYISLLKWLTLALLAFVVAAVSAPADWPEALRGTLIPRISFRPDLLLAAVASFGATINPYLLFWQASHETEEQDKEPEQIPLKDAPELEPRQVRRIQLDVYTGMTYSNAVALAVMLVAAAALHDRGITNVDSASGIAASLEPAAGSFARILFSVGIIGTGMLAVPVLAASLAFAVGELLDWPSGLDCSPSAAKGFYSLIGVAALAGFCLNLLGIKPVTALYWTAVLNGFIAAPIMAVLMLMSSDYRVMGQVRIPKPLVALGWLATLVIALASAAALVSSF